MQLVTVNGTSPSVADSCWIAPDVVLVGDIHVGERSSVFYTSVLRADSDRITIGSDTNIQDGCIVHADPGIPVKIGSGVSVGHRAVLHGCTIENDVLIGMGAIILNGAHIGAGSLIAAGAVVLEGTWIPADSLVAGIPGKVRRQTTPEERAAIVANAVSYLRLAIANREGLAH